MKGRLLAALAAGAIAAVICQVGVIYRQGPFPPLITTVVSAAIGASFLLAGLAAWHRWPASRLGLLFTVTGYAWVLPSMAHLPYALPFTIGNLIANVYAAALAHLALAWPTGRLRSRFECGVVVAVYGWNTLQSLVSMLFWNPATTGCGPGCPANLLLVSDSPAVERVFDAISIPVGLSLSAVVLTLIFRHWWKARGWSRRAMVALVWISTAVIALSVTQTVASNLNLANTSVLLYGIAPVILLTGPAMFVVSTLLARTARGAVGTAIVDLQPGAPPEMLRDALARALGDSTLQLAFLVADGTSYLDTAGRPVDPDQLGPGRALTELAANGAVLVHDQGLQQEPQRLSHKSDVRAARPGR